jgi:hypothetical protein
MPPTNFLSAYATKTYVYADFNADWMDEELEEHRIGDDPFHAGAVKAILELFESKRDHVYYQTQLEVLFER